MEIKMTDLDIEIYSKEIPKTLEELTMENFNGLLDLTYETAALAESVYYEGKLGKKFFKNRHGKIGIVKNQ